MEYRTFIDCVLGKAPGITRDEAELAAEIFLVTLGECLDRTERERLAEQLPEELMQSLLERRETPHFSLHAFYRRFGSRAGCWRGTAVRRARAVAAVLESAISTGELEDVVEMLPEEYGELFGRNQVEPQANHYVSS